jgi:surface polysaccharide O-acyltransferase-like enzyme
VASHVVGGDPTRGLQVSDDSLWRYGHSSLVDLRMPLFTVISGYVYAMRPVTGPSLLPVLARGKVRRLLVPLLFVGALVYASQALVPGTNTKPPLGGIWRVYVYEWDHLWFLQAIFLVFLVVGALDARHRLATLRAWGVALVVGVAVFVAVHLPGDVNFFALNGAIRLFPFFLLGLALRRFARPLAPGAGLPSARVLGTVFLLLFAARLATIVGDVEWWDPLLRLVSVVVGLLGITWLFAVRESVARPWLGWIGTFSFGIYLLHTMAAAGTRIAMEQAGIDPIAIRFPVILALAIALPILFERTLGRHPLVSRLILGVRRRPAAVGPGP